MPHSPEDQIKILKHLVEKVMGAKRKNWTFDAIDESQYLIDNSQMLYLKMSGEHAGKPWNPFESAEDTLGLLERCADCVRMRHLGGSVWVGREKLVGGGFVDATEWGLFCNTATLACYWATGGAGLYRQTKENS